MISEISNHRNLSKRWTVQETTFDHRACYAAVLEPDGGDLFAKQSTAAFDALNPTVAAVALRRTTASRERALRRIAKRAAKHLSHTRRTRTIVTRERQAELPKFLTVEAGASLVASTVALGISNIVTAKYFINSGNDLYASDFAGAHLFAVLPLFAALGIKAFVNWLPSDEAEDRYAAFFFAVGSLFSILWASAAAMTFAPNANGMSWLTASAGGHWTGIVLLLSHVLSDAAWGYILIAAAEKVFLSNRTRIEIINPHHAEAAERAAQAQADHAACADELREIDEYLATVPHRRSELQGRIELALDHATALWRAEQAAALAFAQARFLNRF